MVAYQFRMPSGIDGDINRAQNATVLAEVIDASAPPTKYGRFVKLVSGKIRALASGDDGTQTYGLLARPYPTAASQDGLGVGTPPVSGLCDVMKRGYMTTTLALGTAARGGQVYVVTTAGGSVSVGDIVTAASPAGGGTAVAISGAFFMGPADSQGFVEIAYNI
jgi:hypothetical protein